MAKTLEQWDLPCYPHTKPSKHCRVTCIIRPGHFMNEKAAGYHAQIGGTGEYRAPSLPTMREKLMAEVERRLNDKINEAQAQLIYYQDLLQDFTKYPFKYQVVPDND